MWTNFLWTATKGMHKCVLACVRVCLCVCVCVCVCHRCSLDLLIRNLRALNNTHVSTFPSPRFLCVGLFAVTHSPCTRRCSYVMMLAVASAGPVLVGSCWFFVGPYQLPFVKVIYKDPFCLFERKAGSRLESLRLSSEHANKTSCTERRPL